MKAPHKTGRDNEELTSEGLLRGLGIPLHPGAERAFTTLGLAPR